MRPSYAACSQSNDAGCHIRVPTACRHGRFFVVVVLVLFFRLFWGCFGWLGLLLFCFCLFVCLFVFVFVLYPGFGLFIHHHYHQCLTPVQQ